MTCMRSTDYQNKHFLPADSPCSGAGGGKYVATSSACYFVSSVMASWMAAHKDCAVRRGHLLVIVSTEQHVEVASLLNTDHRYYWIALTRLRWQWSNGEDHYVSMVTDILHCWPTGRGIDPAPGA